MKLLITGICTLIVLIIIVLSNMSIESKSTHAQETNDTTRMAAYHSVQSTALTKVYEVEDTDQAIADFQKDLLSSMNTSAEIKVRILSTDSKEGFIQVEVSETFNYPNGKKKTLSKRDSVIMEEYPNIK